jgi:hypothetical protein
MRNLQKAVNNKDENLNNFKDDFERTKKDLEQYVKDSKITKTGKSPSLVFKIAQSSIISSSSTNSRVKSQQARQESPIKPPKQKFDESRPSTANVQGSLVHTSNEAKM